MEGYSSAVFSSKFENNFSKYATEGFQSQMFDADVEQYNKLNDLVGKYQEIEGDLDKYNELKQELEDGVKDEDGNIDERVNQYNDFGGTKLDINKKPNVKDAAKEDVDTMIIQQNNTYILGMVTVTTLLITSFLFMRG